MVKQSEVIQGTEKEFLNEFRKLCYSRSSWQVWADLMAAIACSISNVADRSPEHYESREKEYAQCIERLGSVEIPAKMRSLGKKSGTGFPWRNVYAAKSWKSLERAVFYTLLCVQDDV